MRSAALFSDLSKNESHTLLAYVLGRKPAHDMVRWPAVVETAKRHRVACLLASRLEQTGMPQAAEAPLRECAEKARRRIEVARNALAAILERARQRHLPVLVFKGPVLSEAFYPRFELRPFHDLDLLVREEDLEAGKEILADLGYRMMQLRSVDLLWMLGKRPAKGAPEYLSLQQTEELYRRHHCHLPFVPVDRERSVPVDLHWMFFRPGYLRLPPSEFWERAVPVEVAGQQALTLSRCDHLLYLCLHMVTDGYCRIRVIKLLDVVQVGDTLSEQEWAELARRAKQYGVERALFLGLWMAYRTVGRPLPSLPMKMRPAALRRMLMGSALSEGALLSCKSPWAEAAWDLAADQPALPALGRMLRTAARQWVGNVGRMMEYLTAVLGTARE